jgi:hypothetical protein
VTLREEHRLKVFENKLRGRIFVPKINEVTGGWRKLYNEELHNLCSLPSTIRMIKSRKMEKACNTNGEKINSFMLLVEKPGGNRLLGRPKRRWVDDIKMNVRY